MSVLPVSVKLVGNGTTNPSLDCDNISGTLSVKNGNLVFTGEEAVHKIPMEHIDKIMDVQVPESWGEEWRFLLGFFLSGVIILATAGLAFIPYIWYFWWEYSSIEVQIAVTAWNEEYGLNATTVFSLGKQRHWRTDAPSIIQEIWRERGIDRQRQQNPIIYRAS